MKRRTNPILALILLVSGCAAPLAEPGIPPLMGSIEGGTARQIAATLSEVGNGATVAFIDPATGNTLSTTLTDSNGRFVLTFAGSTFRPSTGPYFLEAAKGLAMGGAPNRAGASLIRLRSLVSFQSGGWRTLTGESIRIGRSTTALCILSNLKGLDNTQNLALLGRLQTGLPSSSEGIDVPDTFQGDGTLSATEFARAYDLVDHAITRDLDPVAAIFKRPDGSGSSLEAPGMVLHPGLGLALDGWNVTSATPATGPTNTLVTLQGQALPTATADIAVSLNGQACTVTELAPDGSYLRFRVPLGLSAGSYPIRVSIGPWSHSSLTFTVTP